MTELRKSISAYLYERTASPLWGTFIVSWTVWNWKVFYMTFFGDDQPVLAKLDFVVMHLSSWTNLWGGPLLVTFFAITAIPPISFLAYWLTLEYQQWSIKKKKGYDKNNLLSFEESAKLLNDVASAEERFIKTTSRKDNEIAIASARIEGLSKELDDLKGKNLRLVIHKAYYGRDQKVDVTHNLQRIVEGDRLMTIASNETLGGDPFPGVNKQLEIVFTKNYETKALTFNEGDSISI